MEQAQVVAFLGPRSLADVLTNVPQLYFPGFSLAGFSPGVLSSTAALGTFVGTLARLLGPRSATACFAPCAFHSCRVALCT